MQVFFHRLALALGKTVGEIRSSMSVEELNDWMVYCESEPIGPLRSDYSSAIIAAAVVNSQGGKKRVTDFMPFLHAQSKRSASDVETRLHAAFSKAARRLKVIHIQAPKSEAPKFGD